MSFTHEVCEELLRLPVKKTCCRKALLFGLLCNCRRQGEDGTLTAYFYNQSVGELASLLLEKIFHEKSGLAEMIRAGRKTFALTVRSTAVSVFLNALDEKTLSEIDETVGFRCASCSQSFLRGIFLGCATVSDPHKGYHLEMILPTEGRADALAQYLSASVGKPGRSVRGNRFGLFYKSNGAIFDLLYLIGCSKTGFDVANVSIERDIRNNENRATNCVARNISRTVEAARRQIEAIERLMDTRRIDALPEELRYTARLRKENESASLTELALLHDPPISKSGLNRRLAKLMEAAEENKP